MLFVVTDVLFLVMFAVRHIKRILVTHPESSYFTMASRSSSSDGNNFVESPVPLYESTLPTKNPIVLFENWFQLAHHNPHTKEPLSMALATIDERGRPTVRMVSVKGFGKDGFKFYTNYRSSKSKDMAATPYAALVVYWVELCRSVRIEGKVEQLTQQENKDYFDQRPKPMQVVVVASEKQSSFVKDAEELEAMRKRVETRYEGENIPCPEYWGGYRLIPDKVEFWQGQSSRMSNRIVFEKEIENRSEEWTQGEDGWMYQRLQP